jgi:hypothetical protein
MGSDAFISERPPLLRPLFGKTEAAAFHINPGALKSDPLQFKQGALMPSCFSGKQDPAAAAENPVPRKKIGSGGAKRPGDLPRSAGISGRARHRAVGCHFPPRDSRYCFLNILKISHSRHRQFRRNAITRFLPVWLRHRITLRPRFAASKTFLQHIQERIFSSSTPNWRSTFPARSRRSYDTFEDGISS